MRRAWLAALIVFLCGVAIANAGLILSSLEGGRQGNAVVLRWETSNEIEVAGFDIYRSTQPLPPAQVLAQATKLNTQPLIGPNGPCLQAGNEYEFRDPAPPSSEVYYWIVIRLCQGGMSVGNETRIEIPAQRRLLLPLIMLRARP